MAHVLIIDADAAFAQLVAGIAEGLGHRASRAASLVEGRLLADDADVVFLAATLPDGNGVEAMPGLRALPGQPEIIVTAEGGDPDGAERAIRHGAWEWLRKPLPADRVVLPLLRVLDYRGRLPAQRPSSRLKHSIVGVSTAIRRCLDVVAEAAGSDATALVTGETGVGKELFARAIHDNSPRAAAPFVAVDCASLPRSLAGSILFGHRKGAFTGADSNRDGLVLQADGGTLFLDEVGELPLSMQKMFLRVLQEHRFRPVGGRAEITSDFRLIAATNRNLEDMAERNTFRSDLLYRMRTVVVSIPPLRERCEDVTALAGHYLPRIWARFALPEKDISPDFHETLLAYHWPGNVRELIHTLERAVLASQDAPKLFARHLPDYLRICLARAAARNGAAAPAGYKGPGGPSCLYGAGELATPAPPGGNATATANAADENRPASGPAPAARPSPVRAGDASPAARQGGNAPSATRAAGLEQAQPGPAQSVQAQSVQTQPAPPVSPGWGPRAPYAIYTSPHYAPSPERTASTTHAAHENMAPGNGAERPSRHGHATSGSGISHDQTGLAGLPHRGTPEADAPLPLPTAGMRAHPGPSSATASHAAAPFADGLPRFFDFRDAQFTAYLHELMRRAEGDIRTACALSGLSRSHLYDLLRKHGVPPR
uniref:Putative two component, sigma54 specific, transcriptional regulator, Fis family n=1 Tax=Nitratidesulfovibrio vulgaris (strain DSM 19637 / Miyazaki F) TaxID=883 RepID=B8DIS2_NITV9